MENASPYWAKNFLGQYSHGIGTSAERFTQQAFHQCGSDPSREAADDVDRELDGSGAVEGPCAHGLDARLPSAPTYVRHPAF